jgi:hypothetical protein
MKKIVIYFMILIGTLMFASCATDHVIVYHDYPGRTVYSYPYYHHYYGYVYKPAPYPRPHYHYHYVPPKPNNHPMPPKPTPKPKATVRPQQNNSHGGSMSGKRR